MKKFFIKDDDGKKYEVEEVEEVKDEGEEVEKVPEVNDVDGLTSDEIKALKELAKVSPKLIAMCSTTDEETKEINENEVETFDDEEEIEKEEQILKTDSIKTSSCSLEKKQINDAVEADDVADAWSKRYQSCRG